MTGQSWSLMPGTRWGKWSLALIVAMPVLFYIGASFTNTLYKSIPSGNTMMEDIAARPALALTMLAGTLAGVLSFVAGLLAVIRQKERALLVYVASAIGALLIFFLLGEFLLPHP